MCGIAFYWREGGCSEEKRASFEKAINGLAHRGPDDAGVLQFGSAFVGHTRLAIIDLTSSSQPMVSPDQRYVLSFNGEIYNYKELRKSLSSKWEFKTHGDTEVVLAGLINTGVDFLKEMKGMWAICLYDRIDNTLLLTRDRFGKKPLYYANDAHSFAVASELPSLKSLLPDSLRSTDPLAVSTFFRFGFYAPGDTIYSAVKEVKPGYYFLTKLGEKACVHKSYWSLDQARFKGGCEEASENLQYLFRQSLKRRLVSDVEIGLLLSGGVDSSLIAAALQRDFGLNINTFTISFDSASYSEGAVAERVSKHFGLRNVQDTVFECRVDDLKKLLHDNIGQPFGDASLLPTAMACQLASRDVKVCLTGDGADEVFSGYQRYQGALLSSKFNQLPNFVQKAFTSLVGHIPASHKHHSRSLIKKAQLFVNNFTDLGAFSSYVAPSSLAPDDWQTFFPHFDYEAVPAVSGLVQGDDVVTRMMRQDIACYLPQDILLKSDRASMAHSLELRSPFLDDDLVQFALSLPREWHRRYFSGKRMLRAAFGEFLPDWVWERRKQGFAMPLGEWFAGSLGDELLDMKSRMDVPGINAGGLEKMVLSHRAKLKDYSQFLWLTYTYLHWQTSDKTII